MAVTTTPTVKQVLDEEMQQVETARKLRLEPEVPRPAAATSLIGLAFSGGGIRSATFNLGILQALAHERLLSAFDYLSTVSGGGYIGGWLMAWMHHQGIGIQEVEKKLSATPNAPNESADPPEVHFLRDYSNYLTPRKGLLGADFWAFAASYLRNTILNQIILLLALLSLLLLPRSFVYLLHLLENLEDCLQGRYSEAVQFWMRSQFFALGLGLMLAFVAIVFIGLNLVSVDPKKQKRDCWLTQQWAVQAFIVAPLFVSAAFLTYGLGQFFNEWPIVEAPLYRAPLLGIALYFGLWSGALAVRSLVRALTKSTGNGGPNVWLFLGMAFLTGLISGYLFVPFARILIPAENPTGITFSKWHLMTFGTPVAIAMMLISGVLHIGLMGRGMTDAHREWWGRLGGWLVIYGVCWFFLFLIAIYFPAGLGKLLYPHLPDPATLDCWLQGKCAHPTFDWRQRPFGYPLSLTGLLAWIASTAYGVIFGKSDSSGTTIANASKNKRVMGYLAKVAPYAFILGLLMSLSLLAAKISNWITAVEWPTLALPSDYYFAPGVPLVCIFAFVAAVTFSCRVDINDFSIHYLYRNRLIRCYLGASVQGRDAQPFTGFSNADNFALSSLCIPAGSKNPKDARPLPIVNTSLNVVRGKELALQTRKARSFAFTPLYGGFTRQLEEQKTWQPFFGCTKKAGSRIPGYEDGITMGTTMAISGAAASPNMGSYSEPPLAFLMTLFDVRLGWWIGNPVEKQWLRGGPLVGFYWLLRELLGSTNDESKYVYLSDGGHFENLGVYELVRRRCKLIVACDVSCDSARGFADLHNAMEHCRTDFGVEIIFDDLSPLMPQKNGGDDGRLRSKEHFAVGKIRYNPPHAHDDGVIIYIKSSLVKGDPDDVLAYAETNKCFPNDTTANQWFDEAHFENYRALGRAAGASAVDAIKAGIMRALTH